MAPHPKAILTLFLLLITLSQNAQTTLVLQPGSEGKDASIWSLGSNNYGDRADMNVYTWTNSGTIGLKRALIEFDLSQIPEDATITSALLSLYFNPTDNIESFDYHYGDNAFYIQRVTSSWTENTVKWSNQPAYTSENSVALPASTSNTQDYLDMNVTNLVIDMLADNNGFIIKMQNEQSPYRGLLFASSDHPDAYLHPKLVITYTENNGDCITLKPGAEGKDAFLHSRLFDANYGDHYDFAAMAWTNSGDTVDVRSLIEFDLSEIPEDAVITLAHLSLFAFNSPVNGSHSQLSGSNQSVLKRVTSAWDENTVTWSNQPTTTDQNQVFLSASEFSDQDYPEINVTEIVKDMFDDANDNFGFQYRLVTEEFYRSMIFASGDNENEGLHPELEVCWRIVTGINEVNPSVIVNVYPNPGNGVFNIELTTNNLNNIEYSIITINGQVVKNGRVVNERFNIDLSGNKKGIYFLRLVNNKGESWSKKLVLY